MAKATKWNASLGYEIRPIGRFGYTVSEGIWGDERLPRQIHWAFIDPDDSGASGAFHVQDDGAAGADQLKFLGAEKDRRIFSGGPPAVAHALTNMFEGVFVETPISLTSPFRRLFRAVGMEVPWVPVSPWGPESAGPWEGLVLRTAGGCVFNPQELDVTHMPFHWQPGAYIRHFGAMRAASSRLSLLLTRPTNP